ncbi:Ig-like domain-containing protein [Pseudovibrio exalbescens]|uniref:Uncharacterized protein n=1 Tax=Pseudovibrio exalbescens TaxID=197461 RepID=A0A1U7JGP8_9HYPH|nr:Ig-like domain-containing protein [Pseudovibrio exalbescens]OKL43862.1 hypothetical protein A3843_11360 [Pseudovibrio exalbescens]
MVTLMKIAAAVWGRLESLTCRSVTKVAVCRALAVVSLFGATQSAQALDASGSSLPVLMPGGQCSARVEQHSSGATVFIFPPVSGFRAAGGSYFRYSDGASTPHSPITVAWLEANCGYTNVTGLVQDGADGTVASDDQMFVRFTADVPGIGRYDFDYGLYGVTGTVVKRDVVLTDPVPTVTLSGLSSTFINPQTVTATFSETVDGFDASDIQVTNATISSFAGSGATYTFTVSPDGPGAVTVLVPAGVATDSLSFPNLASNTLSGTAEGVSSITADFTANPGFGISVPHTVFFTDQSSSTPPALKTWNWDFGDGDTSTAQNPVHTYTSFGTYTATLETCVYTTCDTQSMTIEVVDVPGSMTPSLSGFSGIVAGAQTVTVEFNAGVDTSDALKLSDFDATNLTLSNLSVGSPTPAYDQTQTYTLTATPDGDGAISLSLPAGAVSNYGSVANTASNTLSGFVDTTAPTITLVDAGSSTTPYVGYRSVLEYTPGTIFELGYSATVPDTVVLMGTTILPDYKMRYTIVPRRDGQVSVTFPAGMFRDVAGNRSAETRIDLGYADVDEPLPVISDVPAAFNSAFDAVITFSKTVQGFTASDIQVSGGSVSALTGSGANYTARIEPDGSPTITISIPAEAAEHIAVSGIPGVFSAAAVPVSTSENTAPVADAGPAQVVAGGTLVTLDGSGSSDPDGDTLAFVWTSPSGITLSDPTAAQPTFTAPQLAPGDPDQSLGFTLTVYDDTKTNTDQTLVTLRANVSATLSGLPDSFSGPGEHQLDIQFSRSVTGLTKEDLVISGGEVLSIAGSAASYQALLRANGRGDLVVSLPARAVQDSDGIPNAASNQLTAVNRIVEQTSKVIADFMKARANNLVSNQPRLAGFLLNGGAGNTWGVEATEDQMNFDLAIAPKDGVWGTFTAAFSKDKGQESGYALATLGSHFSVRPNLKLGAMLQMDYAESNDGPAEVDGYGWLLGPYAVYRLPNHPLVFSGQVLYGHTSNNVAPLGTYRDNFDTERWLTHLGVTGEVGTEQWSLYHFLSATHTRDDQQAYVDALGNTIPSQGFQLTNLELGADFEVQLAEEMGRSVLTGGFSGIWSQTSGSGAAALREPAYDGGRLRLELGYDSLLSNGGRIQFSAFGDGIGAQGYQSYGMGGTYSFNF